MTQLITTLRADEPVKERENAVKAINTLIDFVNQKVELHQVEVPTYMLDAIGHMRNLAVCYQEAFIKNDELLVVIIDGGEEPKETRKEYSKAINSLMDYVNKLVTSKDTHVPAHIVGCASVLTDISLNLTRASINDDSSNYF